MISILLLVEGVCNVAYDFIICGGIVLLMGYLFNCKWGRFGYSIISGGCL